MAPQPQHPAVHWGGGITGASRQEKGMKRGVLRLLHQDKAAGAVAADASAGRARKKKAVFVRREKLATCIGLRADGKPGRDVEERRAKRANN